MRDIERCVLQDMWIGPWQRRTSWSLVAILAAACVLWFTDAAATPSSGMAVATTTILVAAGALSALGLVVRRFVWSCAAAYGCGLSSVIGIGAFWWLRTGRSEVPLVYLVVADVSVLALAVGWIGLVVTPLARSQPEMRTATLRVDEIRSTP